MMANEMPPIEVGDWFLLYGEVRMPQYPWNVETHEVLRVTRLKFYHDTPLSAVEKIRKADGRVWRREEQPCQGQ